MTEPTIRFDDGAAYEAFMGKWSQLAGDSFLDWLAPPAGWRWIDIGCGNGAFTERLVQRCTPTEVLGIDPSDAQLAFAAHRFAADRSVRFEPGDAMALPCADATFDASVMALVIFFVTDPAKAVAEMARVVRPGGSVSAYAWDLHGDGFPFAAMHEEMSALGTPPLGPPSADAARLDTMQTLWRDAGLVQVDTREISVQRTFADFESFWQIARSGPRILPKVAGLSRDKVEVLRERLRARLVPDAAGRITYGARANAVKGVVPRA
jgi:ubiquinone/menaquinone biosynthesis C-methylase UbiE